MSLQTRKIVILNPDYDPIVEKEKFTAAGFEFISANCEDDEETIAVAKDAVGIIDIYCNITKEVAQNLQNCKVIVRAGVGYDMIDVKACRINGIEVCNVPDYCSDEVADHAVTLLLTLQRKIINYYQLYKRGIWDGEQEIDIRRLKTLTLGVIGFGGIGQRFVAKMQEFIPNIVVYDPYVKKETLSKLCLQKVELDNLLQESDIISLHCPLTPENHHIISAKTIKKMVRKPIIINVSRGGLIDQKALVEALKSGKIKAAGLDVIENEPVLSQELVNVENLIITPHIAWYSIEADKELRTKSIEEVLRVIRGEIPHYPVF
ncbi:MAG: C-terminal binding protein [Anaerolineaceae bacterium]|nr:C-terminal binding protein [Anaerolineaceae bacterium]